MRSTKRPAGSVYVQWMVLALLEVKSGTSTVVTGCEAPLAVRPRSSLRLCGGGERSEKPMHRPVLAIAFGSAALVLAWAATPAMAADPPGSWTNERIMVCDGETVTALPDPGRVRFRLSRQW